MASKFGKRAAWVTQLALLTAITIVLQMAGAFVRFGPFQIALVLVPIVIGAAVMGPWEGGWLGAVFGAVVLLNGDAAPFLAVTAPGTILTVMVKGVGAGLAAGAVYRLLEKKSRYGAVLAAAAAAPVVNTGIFVLCCYAFFIPVLTQWAQSEGMPVTGYIFLSLVGLNFVVEFVVNMLLAGVIARILNVWKDRKV